MQSVLVRLREYAVLASDSEREIIKYVLRNPKKITTVNSRELAEATYSSPTTIVRFCKKMGFAGFVDFQRKLIAEVAIQQKQEEENRDDVQREDALKQIIEKVSNRNIDAIEITKQLIEEESIKKTVDLIEKSKTVCVFGLGSSLLVAKDACQKLLRINKQCHTYDDWHLQLLCAKNMTADDLAIAISYSGMTNEVLECARMAQEVGAPLVAITRFAESKLSKMADVNLYVSAGEGLLRSGAMLSRIAQLTIIDILYMAYINGHFEESMSQTTRTAIHKENI